MVGSLVRSGIFLCSRTSLPFLLDPSWTYPPVVQCVFLVFLFCYQLRSLDDLHTFRTLDIALSIAETRLCVGCRIFLVFRFIANVCPNIIKQFDSFHQCKTVDA